MIVSRMISWLYIMVSSIAFFLMTLHMYAYYMLCLSQRRWELFPTILHLMHKAISFE